MYPNPSSPRPQALEQLAHIDWALPLGTSPAGGGGGGSSPKGFPCYEDFLSFRQQLPRALLLMRVGDFYETVGWDAVLLVEHCGNNPMGAGSGVPRAGCPWRNLRRTLALLVDAGLTVVGGTWGGGLGCWGVEGVAGVGAWGGGFTPC